MCAFRAQPHAQVDKQAKRTGLAINHKHLTFGHIHETETRKGHPAIRHETTHHGAGELEAQRLLLLPSRLPLPTGAIHLPRNHEVEVPIFLEDRLACPLLSCRPPHITDRGLAKVCASQTAAVHVL